MKKLFALMAMTLMTLGVNAQITTGESTSNVIRTGNRAQAGNFGIYFGGTTDMFKSLTDGDVNFSALPLINLKYMTTDNFECRLGIEWWKKSASMDDGGENSNELSKSESSFMLSPGIAYHFNNKNLLDVYVGGELPFGFAGNSYENENADMDWAVSNFHIGVGAFIGLQAYIANLPLAVGLEYGISTKYGTVSDGYMSQDGMTIEKITDWSLGSAGFGYKEDRSESKWVLGHQVRFTLSYYFNL